MFRAVESVLSFKFWEAFAQHPLFPLEEIALLLFCFEDFIPQRRKELGIYPSQSHCFAIGYCGLSERFINIPPKFLASLSSRSIASGCSPLKSSRTDGSNSSQRSVDFGIPVFLKHYRQVVGEAGGFCIVVHQVVARLERQCRSLGLGDFAIIGLAAIEFGEFLSAFALAMEDAGRSQPAARLAVDLPAPAAAWYSSAGMVRKLFVFMGSPLGGYGHTSRCLSTHSLFFNDRDVPRKKKDFPDKKRPWGF